MIRCVESNAPTHTNQLTKKAKQMAFLLKINAARRLSGNAARLPRCGVEHFYIAGRNALDGRNYRQYLTCKGC